MKRTAFALALLVLASTVAAAGSTAASSRTSHNGKSITIKLVREATGFNFVDNPPRQGPNVPALIGDTLSFTAILTTKAGARAGTFGATCTAVSGGPNGNLACLGWYALKGGQIMGMAKPSQGRRTDVAIVGGTGAYEGVTGSAVEIDRPDSPISDITIHLIYP